MAMWKCAKRHVDYPSNPTTQQLNRGAGVIRTLLAGIYGKLIGETGIFREHQTQTTSAGLPADFDKLTPVARVKPLGKATICRPTMTRDLTMGAELNILRAAK